MTMDVSTGVFAGPTAGLKYETPTLSGVTNERGEFQYRAGEAVAFLVGGIVLGAVPGAPRINLAQLVNRSDGKIDRLSDPIVTNLARFIQTLDESGDPEGGITIAPAVHEAIGPMVLNFNQAATDAEDIADTVAAGSGAEAMVAFSTNQAITFASDPVVTALLEELNSTPGVSIFSGCPGSPWLYSR